MAKPLLRQLANLRTKIEEIEEGGVEGVGAKGDKGDPGQDGADGEDGLSAYQVALANGFQGSEAAWLVSLKGEKGDKGDRGDAGQNGLPGADSTVPGPKGDKGDPGEPGQDGADSTVPGPKGDKGDTGNAGIAGSPGADGEDGADGLSAYQVAVANGFVGTEVAWLLSLKGAKGDTGNTGQAGPAGSFVSLTASLGADVQIPGSNTFVDGPSLVLPAGTWLVTGTATFQRNATTAVHWVARLSDGTTHHASSQMYQGSVSGHTASIGLSAIIVLAAQTTIKLQGAVSVGSTTSLMKAATPAAGSGNNATRINAVKIA
jgi:hypothetical protein